MIHAISCLVNTPGTRLTLNTLMPTCPFYQPRAIQSSFHRRRRSTYCDRGLFFHVGQSLCLRVSVGSLPNPVTGRRASILILGCLCVTRAVFFGAARKGEIMPRMPLPPRVKPAVRRQNQHLTSQHGENLDFICFCPTRDCFHNYMLSVRRI